MFASGVYRLRYLARKFIDSASHKFSFPRWTFFQGNSSEAELNAHVRLTIEKVNVQTKKSAVYVKFAGIWIKNFSSLE